MVNRSFSRQAFEHLPPHYRSPLLLRAKPLSQSHLTRMSPTTIGCRKKLLKIPKDWVFLWVLLMLQSESRYLNNSCGLIVTAKLELTSSTRMPQEVTRLADAPTMSSEWDRAKKAHRSGTKKDTQDPAQTLMLLLLLLSLQALHSVKDLHPLPTAHGLLTPIRMNISTNTLWMRGLQSELDRRSFHLHRWVCSAHARRRAMSLPLRV